MKKLLLALPIIFSLLTSAYAATTTDSGCPAPNQITTSQTSVPGVYFWNFNSGNDSGQGIGGSQVGSLTSQTDLGLGMMYLCFYNTNTNMTQANLDTKINSLPEKAKPLVENIKGSFQGFLLVMDLPFKK